MLKFKGIRVNSSRKRFYFTYSTLHFDRKNFSHILNFLVKLAKIFVKTLHVIILEFKSRPENLSLKVDAES